MSVTGQPPEASERHAGFKNAIETLLQDIAPEIASAIYLGAIPHWVNRALMQRLVGENVDLSEVFETLVDFQLARLDARGRLHYRDEVRKILLGKLQQNRPEDYLSGSRVAKSYFDELEREAVATERPALQREALYHLLSLDQASGLYLLNEKLEEAFYFRKLGEAEMLVKQAEERREQFSEHGRLWLLYFGACLDLVYRREDYGKTRFSELITKASGQVLQPLARWKLGQIYVKQQRWSEAIKLYKDGLKELSAQREASNRYRARVLMSMGDAYEDLAEQSGGLISISHENYGRASRIFHFLLDLPFVILEWLVHWIRFLPSMYFKANYQDWIIAYLLLSAGRWFRQAEHLFAVMGDSLELTETRLALAKVEYQMGNLSRASYQYALLEKMPEINQSHYRTAKVHLGQSRVLIQQGKLSQAINRLADAVKVFQSFQDMTSAGAAYFLLGQAYNRQAKPVAAAQAFVESVRAFQEEGNSLALSRALWNLDSLCTRSQLPPELHEQIETILSQFPERHSLTRFPQKIIRWYRRLALLFALPLSYGLTVLLGVLGFAMFLIFLEISAIHFTVAELFFTLANIAWLALIIILAAWAGRGIYSIVGLIAVYILGNRLARIEQEQPLHVTIGTHGISSSADRSTELDFATPGSANSQSTPQPNELSWESITQYISLDFMLRQQPIYLISRTILKAGSQVLIIEGMTARYDSFKRDIQNALGARVPAIAPKNHNFTFLEKWSILAAVLFSLVIETILYAVGRIKISTGPDEVPLPVSTIVAFTTVTLIPTIVAVVFWRLWQHRLRLEKDVEYQDTVIPTWLLLAAAIFSTLIVVTWILLQGVIL